MNRDDYRAYRARIFYKPQHELSAREQQTAGGVEDKWLPLCEYCPLPDGCCWPEGDFLALSYSSKKKPDRYDGCLIWEAGKAGMGAEEAIERAKNELG